MFLKYSVLLTIMTFWYFVVNAQEAVTRFEEANKAYLDGNFQKAEEVYSALLDEGYETGELYNNMGNAFYRQHKLPEAILFYEKALKLNPREDEYLHNLEVAKAEITKPLEEVPEFFLDNWWRNVANLLSSSAWSILAVFFLWAGAAGGIIWLFGKKRQNRKLGFLLGIICLLISILPFLLANSSLKMETISEAAIVMQSGVSLKSAPETEQELTKVPSGTKVKLVDTIEDWVKVQLPNGETGWLPGEVMEKI